MIQISQMKYKEYEDTIEKFKKIDYNVVLDQFLNENYNDQLYEKRQQEKKRTHIRMKTSIFLIIYINMFYINQ